jgi:hypothetical protein
MSLRTLLLFGIIGGAGAIAYEVLSGKIGSTIAPPAGTAPDPSAPNVGSSTDVAGFLPVLARVESGGQPYVKAASSSASGLYQFVKATWTGLGLPWGNDPAQAFGGLTPTVAQQDAAAAQLTQNNASILDKFGIAISNASLYAAHFLGPTAAIAVLSAPSSAPVASLISSSAVNANPFLKGMTVADFTNWLHGKVG